MADSSNRHSHVPISSPMTLQKLPEYVGQLVWWLAERLVGLAVGTAIAITIKYFVYTALSL